MLLMILLRSFRKEVKLDVVVFIWYELSARGVDPMCLE